MFVIILVYAARAHRESEKSSPREARVEPRRPGRPESCKPPIHTWVSVMAQAFWSLLGRPGEFWIVLECFGAF